MTEFTPQVAGRVARLVLFEEWGQLVAAGFLNEEGLRALRGRLADPQNEFEPGPDLDLLRIVVGEALAGVLGIDPADMPGAPVVPDDLSEIGDLS